MIEQPFSGLKCRGSVVAHDIFVDWGDSDCITPNVYGVQIVFVVELMLVIAEPAASAPFDARTFVIPYTLLPSEVGPPGINPPVTVVVSITYGDSIPRQELGSTVLTAAGQSGFWVVKTDRSAGGVPVSEATWVPTVTP